MIRQSLTGASCTVVLDNYSPDAPVGCYPMRRCRLTIGSMGSSTRYSLEASTPHERVFIGASYVDLSEADADYQALRQLHVDLGAPGAFDAVTIGRKASGEVRFHRESDDAQGAAGDDRDAPSLAAGLGAALFPSVAADVPVGRLVEREILGTVAGVVAIALGRSGLADFGTHLDSSSAGLIVAAATEQQDSILAVLTNAHRTIARSATVDAETIVRTTDRLHRSASRRQRRTS